jgi:two-component sensor histidine kinase
MMDVTAEHLTDSELQRIEMNHRIKNNLQLIINLISLQIEEENDARIIEVLREVESRINAVSLFHKKSEEAYYGGDVDIGDYIKGLLEELIKMYELHDVFVAVKIDEVEIPSNQLTPLGLIVSELVSNACKYGFTGADTKELKIELIQQGGEALLNVQNNGKPISENIDIYTTKSLGLSIVRNLAQQLDGRIEVDRKHSTNFQISFPL